MRAAIALRDVVGKGQHHLVVAVIPPHRDFHGDAGAFADHVDRFSHDRRFRPVDVFHEFAHAAFVEQLGVERFCRALILDKDPYARVQEGQFAQPVFQRFEAVIEVRERAIGDIGLGAGQKAHLGAAHAGGWAQLMHVHHTVAVFEPGAVFDVIAPNPQLQPL